MKSRIRILPLPKALLQAAGLADWRRRARQDIRIRRSEIPPGYIKSKLRSNKIIKHLNSLQMNSRIRVLRWLSLLLLSAGLVGWSQRIADKAGGRKPYLPQKHPDIFNLGNFNQIIQTYQRTMEIQLKTMRWLSLLMLSEGLRWELQNLAHFSWFRRP